MRSHGLQFRIIVVKAEFKNFQSGNAIQNQCCECTVRVRNLKCMWWIVKRSLQDWNFLQTCTSWLCFDNNDSELQTMTAHSQQGSLIAHSNCAFTTFFRNCAPRLHNHNIDSRLHASTAQSQHSFWTAHQGLGIHSNDSRLHTLSAYSQHWFWIAYSDCEFTAFILKSAFRGIILKCAPWLSLLQLRVILRKCLFDICKMSYLQIQTEKIFKKCVVNFSLFPAQATSKCHPDPS